MLNKVEYNNMFYQMLNRIRKRPGMWLGTSDINALKTYIDGYNNALMDLGIYAAKPQTSLFPLDFCFMHEFAKIKTNSYESTSGWANLILKECDGNQKIALERFFEYFDEFCALKALSMKKAILTDENILANDKMLYSYHVGMPLDISQNDIADNDEQYFRSGNFIGKKSPIYDSPQAVYIIELSGNSGFLCAIETLADIQLIRFIFRKDQILGNKRCSNSPEHVFGNLTTLTEISCSENPDFAKPVH